MQQQTEDPEKLHDRALRLLSYRPRSLLEMRERLLRLGYSETGVETELSRLARVGLLDDDAFAKNFTDHAVSIRRIGRRSVRYELERKGIKAETVEAVTEGLTEEAEEARALALAERRAPRLRELETRVALGRLSGFLLRRGFDGEVVRRVCRQVLLADNVDG